MDWENKKMVKCDFNNIKKGLMQLEDKDYENAIELLAEEPAKAVEIL